MTDIPIPEARLRQFLRVAHMLGSVAITRADTAQHARLSGHTEFAAQIDASALLMAREALSASIFILDTLRPVGTNDQTEG